jgi:aryl-alcohol dehydrogenase-like predicted oxidoreductase
MLARKLGRTGYEVSEIGFGAWGIGGAMWQGVPDDEGRRTLHRALDLGVTFIDTALAYGKGHSERLIGEVLRERNERDRILVATKMPPLSMASPGEGAPLLSQTFPPHHIISCVEESLRNLRMEALHVEQFHHWHDRWLESPVWDESRAAMERLRDEGKVLHWGVSAKSHEPETALNLLRDPLLETVQAIYNIYERTPEEELFDLVRAKQIGMIVRVPLDEGALTGEIGPSTTFPEGDWRERYFRRDRKAEAARRAQAVKALLGDEARSLPELALRFCLSRPEVSTVIPGMRRPDHAHANAAVSDGRTLSVSLLARLRDHAWRKNWYRD